MKSFQQWICSLAKEKSLTAYSIARGADVDIGLMYKILDGKRMPSDETIRKIAALKELETTPEHMIAQKLLRTYGKSIIKEAYNISLEINEETCEK